MPRLRRELPRGNGQPLIIVPGFGTTDVATAPLRRLLNGLGYASYGRGLGRNHGMRSGLRDALNAQLRAGHAESGPGTLVGWSVGHELVCARARNTARGVVRVTTPSSIASCRWRRGAIGAKDG